MSANAFIIAAPDRMFARGYLDTEPGRSNPSDETSPSLSSTGLETVKPSKGPVRLQDPVAGDIICEGTIDQALAVNIRHFRDMYERASVADHYEWLPISIQTH